eukprot:CAMPEP_0173233608 /NCGR_PEP_ID=MMETSP1142-20121109/9709_1 /TAXON_ID=483371 /ORGANISM="non described non described, Strain CCMP2298" /LENGTH=90 /DNA_ID=CAMNT_0014163445 /DNA_START=234 /DNA_END=507 /DNA_ORIENTATION=+
MSAPFSSSSRATSSVPPEMQKAAPSSSPYSEPGRLLLSPAVAVPPLGVPDEMQKAAPSSSPHSEPGRLLLSPAAAVPPLGVPDEMPVAER